MDAPGLLELFGSCCAAAAIVGASTWCKSRATTGYVTYDQDSSHPTDDQIFVYNHHKRSLCRAHFRKVSFYSITVSAHGQTPLRSIVAKFGKRKKKLKETNESLQKRESTCLNLVAMSLTMMEYTVQKGGGVRNGEVACAWIMLREISGAVCAEVIPPNQQRKNTFHFPSFRSSIAADYLHRQFLYSGWKYNLSSSLWNDNKAAPVLFLQSELISSHSKVTPQLPRVRMQKKCACHVVASSVIYYNPDEFECRLGFMYPLLDVYLALNRVLGR